MLSDIREPLVAIVAVILATLFVYRHLLAAIHKTLDVMRDVRRYRQGE